MAGRSTHSDSSGSPTFDGSHSTNRPEWGCQKRGTSAGGVQRQESPVWRGVKNYTFVDTPNP